MADSQRAAEAPRRKFGGLRSTFKAMSDWGDDFERRHFNGDFLGAVGSAPRKGLRAMSDWGDNFEQRHFGGDFAGTVDRTLFGMADGMPVATGDVAFDPGAGAEWIDVGAGAAWPSASDAPQAAAAAAREGGASRHASSGSTAEPPLPAASSGAEGLRGLLEPVRSEATAAAAEVEEERLAQEVTRGRQPSTPDSASMKSCWEEAELLRAELLRERKARLDCAARVRGLQAELHPLRASVLQEREELAAAEIRHAAARDHANEAERALDELSARHHTALGQQARQEAEAQQHRLEAELAAAAAEEWASMEGCGGSREWARDGPETDALKEAKLSLAELLGLVDEVRLKVRRDLNTLQESLAAVEENNVRIRASGEVYEAPQSMVQSVRLLFKIACGRAGDGQRTGPRAA